MANLRRARAVSVALLSWLFIAPILELPLWICDEAAAASDPSGDALYEAVLFQDLAKVKSLVANGADVNYIARGRPLLGWAAQNSGDVEVLKFLLKAGANPNIADEGVGHTPLMRAIDTQQIEAVNVLLKAKANPSAKTPDGESCLVLAVKSRKPEIVKALIEAKADVKETPASGDSAVLVAAQDGMEESYEIIKLLAKAGAPMDVANAAYTPLIFAIQSEKVDLVKLLLESGANPNARVEDSQPPITQALGNAEILEALLKYKPDLTIENSYGMTPLTEAVSNYQIEALKVLLKAGADPKKPNSKGTSAYDYAEQNYKTDIIEIFNAHLASSAGTAAETKTDAANGSTTNIKCTMVDAAKKQMEIHGLLQKQVEAGKMSSDIFRTFGEDTKDYARMLSEDPSEACQLFETLRAKYGL